MKSSNPDIYAVGDSAVVDGKFDQYFPLMSAALKMGRVVGYALAGVKVEIQPILRTIGFSVFDRFFYKTGLTVTAAKERVGDTIERLDIHTPATIHALGEMGIIAEYQRHHGQEVTKKVTDGDDELNGFQ